jgi:hypothetical protein
MADGGVQSILVRFGLAEGRHDGEFCCQDQGSDMRGWGCGFVPFASSIPLPIVAPRPKTVCTG